MEGNGVKTNEEVQATAFAGGIKVWMGVTDTRLTSIEGKLDKVLSYQNKQMGFAAAISLGVTILLNIFF